jgi:iron complex outermembrane recepter protein
MSQSKPVVGGRTETNRARPHQPWPSRAAERFTAMHPNPRFSAFRPLRRLLTAIVSCAALSAGTLMLSAQPATGVIEGRVFDAAAGRALVNARVALDGTNREAITDETGSFRLPGVAAGEARVSVSYLGMAGQTATVSVPAGGTAQREFELVRTGTQKDETVRLDAFTVVVDREMSAQAISMNEQRNAPNIKNVVAIDEFGDRGTENIGEFLLFLPGVSIETSGAEASSVALRGFPGNNTGVTVDGGAVALSFNGGNTRSLDLREVPMNNISRVEVTKVATPDMPASGLGGSLNLISRSGFESKKPKFSFNAYTMFHHRNGITFDGGPRNHVKETSPDWIQPSFDFSYLRPINRNLAITIGGGRSWRAKPMEHGDKTDETADWNIVQMFQRQSQWNSLAQVFRTQSGQIGIDYRLSPQDTLSAGFQYRFYGLYITRSVLTFNYGAGATGDRNHTQGAANGVGTATMNGSGTNVDNVTDTRLYTLKYKHRGDTWRFDFGGSFSGSESDKPDVDEGLFNLTPAVISNITIRGEGIPGSGGIIPTSYSAVDRSGRPVDLYDGGNYSINSGNTAQRDINAHSLTARADLARDFGGRLPFTLKVGAALERTDKDERGFLQTWNFRPNGSADATARLARNFDVFDEAFNRDSPDVYGRKVRWISNPKLFQLFKQRPDWFVSDPAQVHQDSVNNSREFTEIVSAAYIRGDVRLLENRLWLVAGVRFERTDVQGSGPLNDITAQYQRNPDGSFVDGNPTQPGVQRVLRPGDALTLRKLRFVERGAHSDSDYSGWYPSLNASYNLTDNLILRAAYARSLGRPNVNFITPGITITEPDVANPTITVNNPALKPWTADSFDLSLESYQIKDGFGSVGVFHKSIKDFFGVLNTPATPALLEQYGLESDPTLLNYDLSTRTNAGDAKIWGVEFGYRQSLTFLPRWARGVQVFVNATKLELSGSNTADFTGFNPEVYAGGINFVRERFFIKGTISHLGDTRRSLVAVSTANGIPENTYNYQGKRTRIGVNAQYSLSRRYSLYASVNDLGGFVQNLQRYAPNTPEYARGNRLQELGFYYTFGVRGNF